MALPASTSFLFASTLTVLTFAAMQMFKGQLAATKWMTILGGFVGSQLFVFLLTAVGNLETSMFGRNFQTKLFPEVFEMFLASSCTFFFVSINVLTCLGVAMFASGLVHRVCVTTCFLFSLVALYYLNKISSSKHTPVVKPVVASNKNKKQQ